MRVENKSFYADLFTNRASAGGGDGPAKAKSPSARAPKAPQPPLAHKAPSPAPSLDSSLDPSLDSGAVPPGAVKAAKAIKAVPDGTPGGTPGGTQGGTPGRRTPPTASARPLSPRPSAEEKNLPVTENLPAVGKRTDETRVKKTSPLAELIGNVDTHNLTPRQMADLSLDLYAAGAISFDDYTLLAFQPELHPDFNRTIGALTGEEADPDRPRDFVRMWDDRADFQRRHNVGRDALIVQSERIASVLRRIDTPTNVMV